ncbi:MAG: dihydropteroate synthase [Bacteroidales bacterium]|nr:dihydropteroate synthase [Bacteroidales bacterium]
MNLDFGDHKNNAFSETTKFEFGNGFLERKGPLIMGILNLTPDSFFDGGKYPDEKSIVEHTAKLLMEGADIIDIGAVSTRPEAIVVDEITESNRLLPIVTCLLKEFPEIVLSIDTFRMKVAEKMIHAGAKMINDISGGKFDPDMAEFIGKSDVPYVMMHIHGEPSNMQHAPLGIENLEDVFHFFDSQIEKFLSKGAEQLIIDPGIGFGKTVELNYLLLSKLDRFKNYGFPILVGLSRKSLINKVLNIKAADALNGTTVLNTIALLQGANILRVHDVKEAVEARSLCEQIIRYS